MKFIRKILNYIWKCSSCGNTYYNCMCNRNDMNDDS